MTVHVDDRSPGADEADLVRLLDAQRAAWAAGGGPAFAATFTADADFFSVIGEFIVLRPGSDECRPRPGHGVSRQRLPSRPRAGNSLRTPPPIT
ncbi:hypothetical protein IU450_30195 [Nocardia abscessus]|uniref:hypothetical protein n=1 Tax=Nocardia abscessus TaxID=120957 RepID=UPI0018931273|nr:hypothetical protein [Nocardia abscessus]MBF6340128.1 hypothetical protein [Nocardia abscessus]